jgi:hypothetical protein
MVINSNNYTFILPYGIFIEKKIFNLQIKKQT